MKKIYIIPSILIEDVDQENELLAGTYKPKTEDLTGGGEVGPDGKPKDETNDNPEDMAKKNNIFFDLDW